MRQVICVLIAATAFTSAFADESMRCGNALVDKTATVAELLAKCGEPTSKESKTEDVRAPTGRGGMALIGTTTIERWTYAPSNRQFPRVVTIVDGKIKSIETVTN